MKGYQRMIVEATGCTHAEAKDAEEVMRHEIFHSTLDWQPRALFDKAARLAVAYLRGEAPTRPEVVGDGDGQTQTCTIL